MFRRSLSVSVSSLLALSLGLSLGLATAAASAADIGRGDPSTNWPTAQIDTDTVPQMKWRATVNRTLASPDDDHTIGQSLPALFSTTSGADGRGLFLSGSGLVSRRRASDGGIAWTVRLGQQECARPLESAGHVYSLCDGHTVIKQWYDTGVVQWSIAPNISGVAHPEQLRWTSIAGLSEKFPGAGALIVGGSSIIVALDSKTGDTIAQFGPLVPTNFVPTPSNPILFLTEMAAFVPSADSSVAIVLAQAIVQIDPAPSQRTDLIVLWVSLSSMQATGHWFTLAQGITDGSSYTSSFSTQSGHVYVRLSEAIGGGMFVIDSNQATKIAVDAELFPLSNFQVQESTDASNRWIFPSVLNLNANGTSIVAFVDVTNGLVQISTVSLSNLLSATDLPATVSMDSTGSNLVIFTMNGVGAVPFDPSLYAPAQWSWFHSYLFDSLGAVSAFSAYPELGVVSSLQYLRDYASDQALWLIRANSTTSPDQEVLLAFSTWQESACNVTASDCESCMASTGTTTARRCAWCPSAASCVEFSRLNATAFSSTCPDVGIGAAYSCPFPPVSPDDGGSGSQVLVIALIVTILLLIAVPIVYLLWRHRQANHFRLPDDQLKMSYRNLGTPSGSFTLGSSSSALRSPPGAQRKEEKSWLQRSSAPLIGSMQLNGDMDI